METVVYPSIKYFFGFLLQMGSIIRRVFFFITMEIANITKRYQLIKIFDAIVEQNPVLSTFIEYRISLISVAN